MGNGIAATDTVMLSDLNIYNECIICMEEFEDHTVTSKATVCKECRKAVMFIRASLTLNFLE